jgi:thiamine pyrophosphate-dependent acetolactate synthase large subunit-like protein
MSNDTVKIVIDSLVAAGVKYVFGVPGAKIDSVFNALVDHPEIKLVVCRHEQNAAFIAGAVGKVTGRPGVCIATSGPGTSNLVTGLITATDEGSPMVAIVGSVKRSEALKKTHQSLRGVELLVRGPRSQTLQACSNGQPGNRDQAVSRGRCRGPGCRDLP